MERKQASTVTLIAVTAILLVSILAGSCTARGNGETPAEPEDNLMVAVSGYPLAWTLEEIGGDRIKVVELLSASSDLHESELDPAAIDTVGAADLVVVMGGGLQPAVDDALAARQVDRAKILPVIDRLKEQGILDQGEPPSPTEEESSHREDHSQASSHFWLDPVTMSAAVSMIANAVGEASPRNRDYFMSRLGELESILSDLEAAYSRTLEQCRSRALVVYHSAFGLMAERYRLEEISVTGADPEAEPMPESLREAIEKARSERVKIVFSDPESGKDAMQQIALEAGASVEILDPIEIEEPDTDYVARMYENLSKIASALDCRQDASPQR